MTVLSQAPTAAKNPSSFLMRKELKVNLGGNTTADCRTVKVGGACHLYLAICSLMTGGCHCAIWPVLDQWQMLLCWQRLSGSPLNSPINTAVRAHSIITS